MTSNLSKIKPKLRTKGAVSWPRRKGGSPLNDIGVTNAKLVQIAPRSEYIQRMIVVWRTAPTQKLRDFAFHELHRLNCFEEYRISPDNG